MSKKPTKQAPSTVKKRYSLSPKKNRKVLRDLIDYDYLDKLSPDNLDYLEQFSKETYTASFDHKNTGFKRRKPLNNREQQKILYKENNRRNQDILAIKKGSNMIDEIKDYQQVEENREDKLIALLDQKLTSEGFFNLKKGKKKTRKSNNE